MLVVHRVEELADIRIEHRVHPLRPHPVVQGLQGIVGITAGPEPIREVFELLLVDRA